MVYLRNICVNTLHKGDGIFTNNNNNNNNNNKVMPHWKTRMCLHAEQNLIKAEDIKIECGIFQGDSLSPLIFCICLIPLTE
jgi:hypothetical protein